MVKISHQDPEYADYYRRLESMINKEEDNVIVHIAPGSKPQCAAQKVAAVTNEMMKQADWEIVFLDEKFDPAKADVWDNLGGFSMHLNCDNIVEESDLGDRTYLLRYPAKKFSIGSLTRIAWIDCCLFSRYQKLSKKTKGISFYWYIIAVFIVFMLCYFIYLNFSILRPPNHEKSKNKRPYLNFSPWKTD